MHIDNLFTFFGHTKYAYTGIDTCKLMYVDENYVKSYNIYALHPYFLLRHDPKCLHTYANITHTRHTCTRTY